MRTSRPYTVKEKNQVKRMMEEAKTVAEFKRAQSVWLKMSLDLSAEEIAVATGLSENSVHCYQSRVRQHGKKAIAAKKRGGRLRENLSVTEEKELLEGFSKKGTEGELLVVSEVKRAYEKKVGHLVAKSTIYRMLARHGWRKIMPRRRHPKGDLKKQKAFKKS